MSPVAIPDRWRVFGGVLLALLLAYLVLVHWWFTAPMLAMGGEIESMRDQEQALLGEVAQRPQLLKALADVRKFEASNPGFLPESSRELASAGLVLRLQQVVANASPNPNACQITAQTPTDMPTQEPFARVMVQVRLRCGMGELGAVLHALESGSPAVVHRQPGPAVPAQLPGQRHRRGGRPGYQLRPVWLPEVGAGRFPWLTHCDRQPCCSAPSACGRCRLLVLAMAGLGSRFSRRRARR